MQKKLHTCRLIIEMQIKKTKGLAEIIEIPKEQVVLAFVATCIETTARQLKTTYKEVYDRIKQMGMIEKFIIPSYETLHSESREKIAEEMIDCMHEWEERQ